MLFVKLKFVGNLKKNFLCLLKWSDNVISAWYHLHVMTGGRF